MINPSLKHPLAQSEPQRQPQSQSAAATATPAAAPERKLGYSRDGQPIPLPPQLELFEYFKDEDAERAERLARHERAREEARLAIRRDIAAEAAAKQAQASKSAAPMPSAPAPTQTNEPRHSVSDAQLAANRANAQKSTGPTTETGRATSSQNRTVHGLTRHNGDFRLLHTEDPAKFAALKDSLAQEHLPETETEAILVNTMVESLWLSQRASKLQETCSDPNTGQITDPQMFNLYLRYATTHTRSFHKSLNDLLKLRKEKRSIENGFVAQERKAEQLALEIERIEMKRQKHTYEVLLKDAQFCHQMGVNIDQQYRAKQEDPNFDAKYAEELRRRGFKNSAWGVAKPA